ncbi:hypothetical protein PR048_007101 [Dryococelus australis]|uniref:Uncharacterized protein n=1 Tax=Dryococelus australis TaxID=614101 RepID=A0ABQ9ICQ2_9NEOP|nr:hypothetical protein PR048_007101 [Dryococelus australis]
MGRCVFVVLLHVLTSNSEQRVFDGGVKELMNANGGECSRAILSVVTEHEIKYEDIVAVISDSASYITKCGDSVKILFSGDIVHILCWAHKLNIVTSLWSSSLSELKTCVQNVKSAIDDLIEFLSQVEGEGSSRVF